MRYADTDALRDDLTACAAQVTLPATALDRINATAHRLRRRRRAAATAATGAAVGAGLVTIPLVRLGQGPATPSSVLATTSTAPSATPTPASSPSHHPVDATTPAPTSSHHPVDPTTWPCGTTGWDGSPVRSEHGHSSPEAAVRAVGYGTGRFSARYDVRPGTVGLREYDKTTGELVGVYTIDRLDDGSWSVHSVQQPGPCS